MITYHAETEVTFKMKTFQFCAVLQCFRQPCQPSKQSLIDTLKQNELNRQEFMRNILFLDWYGLPSTVLSTSVKRNQCTNVPGFPQYNSSKKRLGEK